MILEQEILERLREGKVALPPLTFMLDEKAFQIGDRRVDAVISAQLDGLTVARFAVECKALSTPKAVQSALDAVRSLDLGGGLYRVASLPASIA